MRYLSIILLVIICQSGTDVSGQAGPGYFTVAASYIDRSMYARAIEIYTGAMEKNDDHRLFTARGKAFLLRGDIDAAVNDFSYANMLKPGSGYLGLAKAYALAGNKPEAIENLKYHLQSDYRLPRKNIMLDTCFRSLEDTPGWRELWKTPWYSRIEEAVAEAEYYINTGKTEEAGKVLSEIEYIYSDRAETNYLKGLVAAANNNTSLAREQLRRAIEKDGSDYSFWNLYIEQLIADNDYLAAANACSAALEYFPEKTALILKKSENLYRAGDPGPAMEETERYLELYPGDEEAVRLAGTVAAENGEYNKSLSYFSKNIDNYPGNPECFTDRAAVYLKIRSWDAAVYDYSMALDLWPRNGDAYYNKGIALINSGNTEKACHDFRMALKYGNSKAASMLSKHCIR